MPKPITVALHIGAHKTASSHFQKSLVANKPLLIDAGIRTYGPEYLRVTGRSLGQMFGLGDSPQPPKRTPEQQLSFLAKGGRRVVLSEENFCGTLHTGSDVALPLYAEAEARLAGFAAAIAPVKPQVFLAIRNPADFLSSAFSQMIIGGKCKPVDAKLSRAQIREIDWADLVARIRSVAGLGEVYVWCYEDYQEVFALVCRRMLRWQVGGKVQALPNRVHMSLSERAVLQVFDWHEEGKTGDLGRAARQMFPVSRSNPKFDPFGDATHALAADRYAAQIAQIEAMEGVTLLRPPKKG